MGASHSIWWKGTSSEAWKPLVPPRCCKPSRKAPVLRAQVAAASLLNCGHSFISALLSVASFSSQWFQSTVSKEDSMPETLKSLIFPNFEPLHKFHTNFLKEIEQRLALWWVQLCLTIILHPPPPHTPLSSFSFHCYFYVVPFKQPSWEKVRARNWLKTSQP